MFRVTVRSRELSVLTVFQDWLLNKGKAELQYMIWSIMTVMIGNTTSFNSVILTSYSLDLAVEFYFIILFFNISHHSSQGAVQMRGNEGRQADTLSVEMQVQQINFKTLVQSASNTLWLLLCLNSWPSAVATICLWWERNGRVVTAKRQGNRDGFHWVSVFLHNHQQHVANWRNYCHNYPSAGLNPI